jgi:hypothetical protein
MPKPRQRRERQLCPILHIYCEGAKTEPFYLEDYIRKRFPGTKLIRVEKTSKTTPRQLVEVARDKLRCGPEGDVVWVVYDREGPAKYSDSLHADARQKAGGKVQIALSSVCFEVWLLLHFQATCGAHDSCDDLLRRSRLKEHIPGYDKANRREYSAEEIARARQSAERLNESTRRGANSDWTQPHQWNPYTDMHKLLDAIDEFGKKYCSRSP